MMSERVIRTAVQRFEESLRIMARDNQPVHAFDLGEGSDGLMWSVLITLGPKEAIDRLCGTPIPSEPLSQQKGGA